MATCPICFEDIKVKASPDSCDHLFCLSCLEKWSKLGSFCPVDRKRYKKIVNLESDSLVQVKSRKRKKSRTVYDFSAKCEVCSDENKPEVLLLCDCCDLAYHIHCLSPPLKTIPAGLWFCPTCISVEKRLKERNGITKEVEVDLCNSNLLFQKGRRHGQRTREKFAEVKEDPETTLDEFKNDKFTNDKKYGSSVEACKEVVMEFESINSRRYDNEQFLNSKASSVDIEEKIERMCKSFRFEPQSFKNKNVKAFKTYDIQKHKENFKAKIERQHINIKNQSANDLCLKQSNEVSLLDDCLSQASTVGCLKFDSIEIDEEKYFNQISPTLPSCSAISDESIKGTFKTLISHLCVDPCLKGTDFEIDASKNKNTPSKEKISFSVFDKIESVCAPSKKYFDVSPKSYISVSSNLNVSHCFSCKDVIIAASQNYCKICKLKYSISCSVTEKDKKHYSNGLKYSQAFESSCDISKEIKNKKMSSQRGAGKNMKKVLERRQHSLIRKLRKIRDSQNRSETC